MKKFDVNGNGKISKEERLSKMDEVLGLFADPDGIVDETEMSDDAKSSDSQGSAKVQETPVKKEAPAEVADQKSTDADSESNQNQNKDDKSSRDEL